MDWDKFTTALKTAPGVMSAIAITTFSLLALPVSVSAELGLQPIIQAYRGWLVISCFFSSLIALIYGALPWIANRIRLAEDAKKAALAEARSNAQRSAEETKLLANLSAVEKQVLWTYANNETKVMYFNPMNATPRSLAGVGIMTLAPGLFNALSVGYMVQGWAWSRIQEEPSLLNGRTPGPYKSATTQYAHY